MCERARPGVLRVVVSGVAVGMESIRSWASARVEEMRASRSEGEDGAMSVAQERGERDLKGWWWDIFVSCVQFSELRGSGCKCREALV